MHPAKVSHPFVILLPPPPTSSPDTSHGVHPRPPLSAILHSSLVPPLVSSSVCEYRTSSFAFANSISLSTSEVTRVSSRSLLCSRAFSCSLHSAPLLLEGKSLVNNHDTDSIEPVPLSSSQGSQGSLHATTMQKCETVVEATMGYPRNYNHN